jgi:hypothetical protein
VTHGMSKTPEHRAWCHMNRRCKSPADKNYPNYGGRGITVCERWQHSFEDFYADMGPRPSNRHSLDRINNDGNYEPSNCRWATPDVQAKNTRVGKRAGTLLTFDGRTLSVKEWSRELGFPRGVILHRLSRGWPVEDALTTPVGIGHAKRKAAELAKRGVVNFSWNQYREGELN